MSEPTIYIRRDSSATPEQVAKAVADFRDYIDGTMPDIGMPKVFVDRETATIADLEKMSIELPGMRGDAYLITRINVPRAHRGKGHGTAILKRILAEADARGVTLYLEPLSTGAWPRRTLIEWYKRHGFVMQRGYMRRDPQERTTQSERKSDDGATARG